MKIFYENTGKHQSEEQKVRRYFVKKFEISGFTNKNQFTSRVQVCTNTNIKS